MNYGYSFDPTILKKVIENKKNKSKYTTIQDFFAKTRFIFSSHSNYYIALHRGTLSKHKLSKLYAEAKKIGLHL